MKHDRGLMLLDHLINGAPPPPDKSPKSRDEVATLRARNADLVACSLAVAPLVAIVTVNNCACGNNWRLFDGWGRKGRTRLEQQADALIVKRLPTKPLGEQVADVEYIRIDHTHCINCYSLAP